MKKLSIKLNDLNIYLKEEVNSFIKDGKVSVNNETIKNPNHLVSEDDIIFVNNQRAIKPELKYFLINKPINYLSNPFDKVKSKNIKELFLEEHQNKGLNTIAKIDYKHRGIMVLTNDLELIKKHNQLNLGIEYGYDIKLNSILKREDLKKIKQGIKVDNAILRPNYIKVTNVNPTTKQSTIKILINDAEIYHLNQMFKSLNYKLISVNRFKYDFLTNESLKQGTYRELKIHEMRKLHRFIIKK
ncbi:MAG: pseudouridine synthase [Acholeplasmataceae bacterium]